MEYWFIFAEVLTIEGLNLRTYKTNLKQLPQSAS
jgi:hypothetical protein